MRKIELSYTLTSPTPERSSHPVQLRNPMMDVLHAVRSSGSISGAARELGLSYRHVWGQLKDWEAGLGQALIFWERGQAARLTPFGERLLMAERLAQARLGPQMESLRAELERAFGDWRAPDAPRGAKSFGPAVAPGQSRIVLINRPQSPQSLIYGGVLLPMSGTDDLLTLNTANTILGTDFLSRINADLRETKGWSYGVRGTVNQLEHQAPYFISAPVQANRTGESIAALLEQYNAFLTDRGVTPEELDRTINGNTRSLAGGFETSAQLLGALRSNALYQRPDDYYETVASRTRALTAADLDAAARAAINPGGIVWVVVGDAAVVRPQLDALGLPVEVREVE
ncbi:MAG: insulinase family protein [Hydrogenophaga sp.]|uniref:insulinase family protein n=1 Tax=Hydrogenophaga sp. TaxID=1904254 RepID=UPI0025B89426|nr:insulinase family protein [Hydrogenophaga sp.]MBU7574933.1 insulinase family protein [Hydrogenophaga sp.]